MPAAANAMDAAAALRVATSKPSAQKDRSASWAALVNAPLMFGC
jgi:hypothetical protein